MREIALPGRPGETIEALSDDELDEVLDAQDKDDEIPLSWSQALAAEVYDLRSRLADAAAFQAEAEQLRADLAAAVDERDRAQAALAAEREVSDSRAQRIAELEGLASLAACAIDVRLTAAPAWHNLAELDEALATVSREAKALLGADPHVDARDQPELMRRSEVKA
jgi:hypothetical protein